MGAHIIASLSVVCDLGVFLDSELSMTSHITKISSVCYYQPRRLKQVRRVLWENITARLVSTFVVSRLDYCNAILAGLPQSTMAPFQRVQNAAITMVKRLGSRDHITEARRNLHWLPIKYRVIYKLCILMHMVHIGCVWATSPNSYLRRQLFQDEVDYALPADPVIHHKIGERAFSYAGSAAWTWNSYQQF